MVPLRRHAEVVFHEACGNNAQALSFQPGIGLQGLSVVARRELDMTEVHSRHLLLRPVHWVHSAEVGVSFRSPVKISF